MSFIQLLMADNGTVASSTTLAADDFNRADGALGTSSHGETWTQETSGSTFAYAISGNKAMANASGAGQHCIAIAQGTYTVSCDITPNVSGADNMGLIVKSPNTLNNCITAFFEGTSGNFRLCNITGGVYTDLGTPVSGFTTNGTVTYNVSVSVDGSNNYVAKVNGTPQIPGNDATYSADWNAGIWNNNIATGSWDNFLAVA